ncbi:S-adenosylmethionine transporter, partial [Actinomortierella ambigua]
IKVPREVITSRLQTGYYAHVANVNAPYVFKAVLREEGPRGLFRGFLSTTARDCPFMVILFTTYENFKAFHTRNMMPPPQSLSSDPNVVASSPVEVKIPAMTSTLFGGISGFLAGYFTTPMDVVRTRIMTFKKSGNTRGVDLSMTGVSQQIYREAVAQTSGRSSGGIVQAIRQGGNIYRAFFVGSAARSVWWFCVCSIFFSTYEVMKQRLMPLDYEETPRYWFWLGNCPLTKPRLRCLFSSDL